MILADTQPLAPWLVVLIAAGISCALAAGLSFLLVVAEKYLINYGACTVDINDGGRTLDSRPRVVKSSARAPEGRRGHGRLRRPGRCREHGGEE